jgi:hypothetical protein
MELDSEGYHVCTSGLRVVAQSFDESAAYNC